MSQVSTITRGCEQRATYIEGVFVDKQKNLENLVIFGLLRDTFVFFVFFFFKVLKEVKFNLRIFKILCRPGNVLPDKLVPNF